MAKSKQVKLVHFHRTVRVQRGKMWFEGWAEVSPHGMPMHPYLTQTEALARAKQLGAQPVFHDLFQEARSAVLSEVHP